MWTLHRPSSSLSFNSSPPTYLPNPEPSPHRLLTRAPCLMLDGQVTWTSSGYALAHPQLYEGSRSDFFFNITNTVANVCLMVMWPSFHHFAKHNRTVTDHGLRSIVTNTLPKDANVCRWPTVCPFDPCRVCVRCFFIYQILRRKTLLGGTVEERKQCLWKEAMFQSHRNIPRPVLRW